MPVRPPDQTDEARRPITFRDLLTHRAGLSYADFHRGPVGRAYADTLGTQIDNALTPDEWIARLAALPLVEQPGANFHYGHSSDLLGFLILRDGDVESADAGAALVSTAARWAGVRVRPRLTGWALRARSRDK